MWRSVQLSPLFLAALILQGCAAAALPALAGGAMVRSTVSSDGQVDNGAPAPIEQDIALAEPTPSAPVSGPVDTTISAQPSGKFAGFARFALRTADAAKINGQTSSAMLVNPGMLDGERRRCEGLPPAILIDLDHGEQTFIPHDAYSAPAELAAHLVEIRAKEIRVSWISAASVDQFGAIRFALSQSGLDKDAEDVLLLKQYEDERKQTRRNEFGRTHCILAIAGDTLADFDELFLFLKSPDAAQSLQSLIGDGWFITPLALTKL